MSDYSNTTSDTSLFIVFLITLGLIILAIVAQWKLFNKVGLAGWKSLIPFYGLHVFHERIMDYHRRWLWLVMFIPFIGYLYAIYYAFIIPLRLNHSYIMALLNVIFSPITVIFLAFSRKTKYIGPLGESMIIDLDQPTMRATYNYRPTYSTQAFHNGPGY